MSDTSPSHRMALVRRATSASIFCGLTVALAIFCTGCGAAKTADETADRIDPKAEFEWGMERLERALRDFSPSGAEGVKVTDRVIEHDLYPPDEKHPNYRALVTITTKTAFLHEKRQTKKKEEPTQESEEELDIKDPLADPEDELSKVIDIPGTGLHSGTPMPVETETRTLESKTVFKLEYLDGRWELTNQPEKKHEKLWFEYAFG